MSEVTPENMNKKPFTEMTRAEQRRAKFDPAQPVDNYNPFPIKDWPFKPGERVIYFSTRTEEVKHGRVDWYHPARSIDHSFLVTPGVPLLFVVNAEAELDREPCLVEHVRKPGKKNECDLRWFAVLAHRKRYSDAVVRMTKARRSLEDARDLYFRWVEKNKLQRHAFHVSARRK